METWKLLPGYNSRYEVSDMGNVRSLASVRITSAGKTMRTHGRPIKPTKCEKNRRRVGLGWDGKKETRLVAHLVLETFVGPCPPGQEACHYNDISDDDRLENLRWDTRLNNVKDQKRNREAKIAQIVEYDEVKR